MSSYNLKSIPFPILTGRNLRLFAASLENPVTRRLLLPKLLRDGGIITLRQQRPEEPTTNHPLHPHSHPLASDVPIDFGAITHAASQRMQTATLPLRSIRDFARAYALAETNPVAVAERVIAAIKESDQGERPLRAFIASNADDIMTQAKASAERIKKGKPISIFDGVPMAIKDELDMLPYPTTVGTRFLGRRQVRQDATVVARLRAAGALLLGKTNMHEIGINPNGINSHYGAVRNPYHLDHDSGGSSSGSAAAVAAGLVPVAIGADGGGSVRIPAAFCGMVGLKATFGRISEMGAAPLDWSIAHIGPIGVSVEDVALSYAAIAGPDPADQWARYQPDVVLDEWLYTNLDDSLAKPVTLGVYWPWFEHATPEIVATCRVMLDKLADMGATIREIEIPELSQMRIAHSISILGEMAASMAHYPDELKTFGPSTRVSLALGRAFTAGDYIQAQRVRTRAIDTFNRVFEEVDAVITPATAVTAPFIPPESLSDGISDLSTVLEAMRYAFPGNLTGLPAITFPAGYDTKGLPIGMQAMGRPWEEDTLLRIAHAAEQVVERKRPSLYFDLLN